MVVEERVKGVVLRQGRQNGTQVSLGEGDLGKRGVLIDEVRTWGRQTSPAPGHRWSRSSGPAEVEGILDEPRWQLSLALEGRDLNMHELPSRGAKRLRFSIAPHRESCMNGETESAGIPL